MSLDIEKLKGKIPNKVYDELQSVIDEFQINTILRMSHFLSQCAHESGNFTLTEENLNYSAKSLLKVFSKYFNEDTALEYERKPEKIGSRVYANRMGNGNEDSKEGYKFRGRGYIQLTGKDNYSAFGKLIDVDLVTNPNLVATEYPLLSASWFFKKNGINEIADRGSSEEVVKSVTKRINGGYIGLDERLKLFKKYYDILK